MNTNYTQTKNPGDESSGLRKWRLPTLPQYSAVQYHRRCCLSALCSLCCPRPSPLRSLPRAAGAHSPHPTPSATADTAHASEAGLAM